MRDDKTRASVHQRGHSVLDDLLGMGVNIAGRFVEDHDRIIGRITCVDQTAYRETVVTAGTVGMPV